MSTAVPSLAGTAAGQPSHTTAGSAHLHQDHVSHAVHANRHTRHGAQTKCVSDLFWDRVFSTTGYTKDELAGLRYACGFTPSDEETLLKQTKESLAVATCGRVAETKLKMIGRADAGELTREDPKDLERTVIEKPPAKVSAEQFYATKQASSRAVQLGLASKTSAEADAAKGASVVTSNTTVRGAPVFASVVRPTETTTRAAKGSAGKGSSAMPSARQPGERHVHVASPSTNAGISPEPTKDSGADTIAGPGDRPPQIGSLMQDDGAAPASSIPKAKPEFNGTGASLLTAASGAGLNIAMPPGPGADDAAFPPLGASEIRPGGGNDTVVLPESMFAGRELKDVVEDISLCERAWAPEGAELAHARDSLQQYVQALREYKREFGARSAQKFKTKEFVTDSRMRVLKQREASLRVTPATLASEFTVLNFDGCELNELGVVFDPYLAEEQEAALAEARKDTEEEEAFRVATMAGTATTAMVTRAAQRKAASTLRSTKAHDAAKFPTDDLMAFQSLEHLSVRNNDLTAIECNLPPKLTILSAGGNRISSIVLPATHSNLVCMLLSGSSLETLEFLMQVPSLKILDVSVNKITDLAKTVGQVQGHGGIVELTMSGNPIALTDAYRWALLSACPFLEALDGAEASELERKPLPARAAALEANAARFTLRILSVTLAPGMADETVADPKKAKTTKATAATGSDKKKPTKPGSGGPVPSAATAHNNSAGSTPTPGAGSALDGFDGRRVFALATSEGEWCGGSIVVDDLARAVNGDPDAEPQGPGGAGGAAGAGKPKLGRKDHGANASPAPAAQPTPPVIASVSWEQPLDAALGHDLTAPCTLSLLSNEVPTCFIESLATAEAAAKGIADVIAGGDAPPGVGPIAGGRTIGPGGGLSPQCYSLAMAPPLDDSTATPVISPRIAAQQELIAQKARQREAVAAEAAAAAALNQPVPDSGRSSQRSAMTASSLATGGTAGQQSAPGGLNATLKSTASFVGATSQVFVAPARVPVGEFDLDFSELAYASGHDAATCRAISSTPVLIDQGALEARRGHVVWQRRQIAKFEREIAETADRLSVARATSPSGASSVGLAPDHSTAAAGSRAKSAKAKAAEKQRLMDEKKERDNDTVSSVGGRRGLATTEERERARQADDDMRALVKAQQEAQRGLDAAQHGLLVAERALQRLLALESAVVTAEVTVHIGGPPPPPPPTPPVVEVPAPAAPSGKKRR